MRYRDRRSHPAALSQKFWKAVTTPVAEVFE